MVYPSTLYPVTAIARTIVTGSITPSITDLSELVMDEPPDNVIVLAGFDMLLLAYVLNFSTL